MVEIWLSFNNKEDEIRLPVVPPEIQISKGNEVHTVNIHEVGEALLIGKSKLAQFTIDTFYPSQPYSFCQYSNFPSIEVFEMYIEKWRNSGKPIRVIVASETYNINMAMAIVDYNSGIVDGTKDLKYELELIEYPFITVKENNTNTNEDYTDKGISKTAKNRPSEKVAKSQYTIREGDSLWEIAKRNFGSADRWKEIAGRNGITNPNKLPVGKTIQLYDPHSVRT